MLDSPWPVWYVSAAYLLFIWLGPKYMRHKKPLNLKTLMITYNLVLVIFSAYMAIEVRRVKLVICVTNLLLITIIWRLLYVLRLSTIAIKPNS